MRLIACSGIILLALGACTNLPKSIRIEVDGSTVEFKKNPAVEAAEPGPAERPAPSDAPGR